VSPHCIPPLRSVLQPNLRLLPSLPYSTLTLNAGHDRDTRRQLAFLSRVSESGAELDVVFQSGFYERCFRCNGSEIS
jgi:hypothetical protein